MGLMQLPESNKKTWGPVTLGMILFGFFIFGILAMSRLHFTLFPARVYPGLSISVENTGKDVSEIEELITVPLEESISGIGGIQGMNSYVERGKSETTVEFGSETNLSLKSLEIREAIDPVASLFPRDVHKPIVYKYDPDERPAIIITLKSDRFNFVELREIADHEVKRNLENIEGISKIIVSGGKVREVIVSSDMEKLRAYGLDLIDIQQAIQSQNLSSSIAQVNDLGRERNIVLSGKFQNIQQISSVALFSEEIGSVVHLYDVAEIQYSYRDDESGSRLNGHENVSVHVYKTAKGNLLDTSNEVRKNLENIKISGVSFKIIYDQAELVKKSYLNFALSSIVGIFFYSLWMLWRNPFANHEFLWVSLFQLVFGFLVICLILFLTNSDFSIITFASIFLGFIGVIVLRFNGQYGSKSSDSYGVGTENYILTITLILASCTPFYFVDPEIGLMAFHLGMYSCIYLILAKLVESPLSMLLPKQLVELQPLKRFAAEQSAFKSISLILPQGPVWLVLFLYLLLVGFGVFYFFSIRKELFFTAESAKVLGYVELPSGTGFGFTNELTKKIEDKVLGLPEIMQLSSRIDSDHAFLMIELKNGYTADESFIESLKNKIGNTNPAFCYFSSEADSAKTREITIDILGDDVNTLDRLVRKMAQYSRGIRGVKEVILRYKNPRDELKLRVDNDKSFDAGINNLYLGRNLQMAIQGAVVSKYIQESRELDIRVRFSEKFRDSKRSLSQIYMKGANQKFIPLSQITDSEESKSPVKIYRRNKKRMLSFSMRVGDISYDEIYSPLKEYSEQILPENYYIEMTRNIEKSLELNREFSIFAVIAIILIYMIISSYFESFKRPTKIFALLALPSSLTFCIMGSFFSRLDLSLFFGFLFLISFSVVILVQNREMNKIGQNLRWDLFSCVFFLSFPQILFSQNASIFLGRLLLTILVGIGVLFSVVPHLRHQINRSAN